jgi:hypothetical protein
MAAAQASDQPMAAGMVRVLYRACSPRVAALSTIETTDGVLVAEPRDPAATFAGTTRSSPWDEFQVAHFTGEANRNYLVAPFLFARLPGMSEARSRTAGRGSVTARSGDGAS